MVSEVIVERYKRGKETTEETIIVWNYDIQ
jgi:hypothetical protein